MAIVLLNVSCKKDPKPEPKPTPPENIPVVSQFVYDGLSLYYFWADEVKTKKPTSANTDAQAYFKSVLNATDLSHGWSWLTDDVEGLLADFAGEPKDFGFAPMILWYDKEKTRLIAYIKYVFPNTPAYRAGLQRGNVIEKINGSYITLDNYKKLFGTEQITLTVLDANFSNPKDNISITPEKIETDPVLYSSIYEIEGKKIGYLFYTGFISNYNKSLYRAFEKFQQAGITDLVLDLRYNHGGAISAASYLASLIAPRSVVENKSTFSILSYNNSLNNELSIARRSTVLGTYSEENGDLNPLNANLNLNTVYIIATGDSYSASELTTFCLRPFMKVVHIGEETGGKYTASFTVHGYDKKNGVPVYDINTISAENKASLKNWAMQPIVAKYTDKDGKDFSNPGTLIPDYPIKSQEYNTKTWQPIGSEKDYLFAKAISLITGKPYIYASFRKTSLETFTPTNFTSQKDKLIKESVNIDNPKILKNLKDIASAKYN